MIAVQDGEIVADRALADARALRRCCATPSATPTPTRSSADVSAVYPVLEPHVHSHGQQQDRSLGAAREPAPSGPATAGAQPRSPISEGATVSGLALGAPRPGSKRARAAAPATPAPPPVSRRRRSGRGASVFRAGSNDVYLHPLRVGRAGDRGHGARARRRCGTGAHSPPTRSRTSSSRSAPPGAGAPLIDPKPILDGWVALENTSIFRAKGENPFLATSPTIGQVLLESKQQLEPQVLHDGGIRLGRCGRQDVQSGRVDKRVLAMLEYLSVSGLKPTVAGLQCVPPDARLRWPPTRAAGADAARPSSITAVNGIPSPGTRARARSPTPPCASC